MKDVVTRIVKASAVATRPPFSLLLLRMLLWLTGSFSVTLNVSFEGFEGSQRPFMFHGLGAGLGETSSSCGTSWKGAVGLTTKACVPAMKKFPPSIQKRLYVKGRLFGVIKRLTGVRAGTWSWAPETLSSPVPRRLSILRTPLQR